MASRICIKNLSPRLYNEEKIRRMFNEFGEITDIVLPGKGKGKTGLAFVGFANKESGLRAIQKKNGTFEGTIKLIVTEAKQTHGRKRPASEESKTNTNKKSKFKKDDFILKDNNEEANDDVIKKIKQNGRLLLRNLPHCCTDDNLRELIGDAATKELRCLINHNEGICTGIGYIQFDVPEDAIEFYKRSNGLEFMGRYLKLYPCDDRKELNEDKRPLLQGKVLPYVPKSRQDMGSKSWNALFLGSDTVAEIFSKKLNIAKSDLLGADSKLSPIVALSIAEMRILKELREFLLENNINIYCFNDDVPKSRKVIIVKNLPQNIEADTVKRTFQQFGEIRRFIFNEDVGMSAIFEFSESAAQIAFERMNGAMYKKRPLKLEFAPVNIFDKPPNKELADSEVVKRILRLAKENLSGNDLNVTNLIKSTILIQFTTADIPENYDLRNIFYKYKNKIVGYGFLPDQTPKAAFILFKDNETAEAVEQDKKATLNREEILSVIIADENSIIVGERTALKTLSIKNLPFNVNDAEIKTIMETIGPVKEVRLPISMDGKKRGFGFVEFTNGGDVYKALELFSGVHFSGRRMVIEISKVKETIKVGKEQKKKNQKLTKKHISSAIASQRM